MRHGIALLSASRIARLCAALPLLASAPSCRLEDHKMDIEVHEAWARPAPAGANSAAYFVFENETAVRVTVDSVLTDVARAAQIHETMISDGMAHMHAVGPMTVPADSTVELRPGGKHVMLLELARDLAPGDRVPLVLVLSGGRRIDVQAIVREP